MILGLYGFRVFASFTVSGINLFFMVSWFDGFRILRLLSCRVHLKVRIVTFHDGCSCFAIGFCLFLLSCQQSSGAF